MKPFLTDRPRLATPIPPCTHVAASSALGTVIRSSKTGPERPADEAAASQVECVRQGDKIIRLIVTCRCGDRIEIDCLYAGT